MLENSDLKRRKYNIHSIMKTKPNNLFNKNNEEENNKKKEEVNEKEIIKMILTIFDLKIIYLINYQDKYYSTFLFHPQIKKHLYFGYIIRLYSCIYKFSNNNIVGVDKTLLNIDPFFIF